MKRNLGFTLADVLVSLLLVTSVSLALLKQQWQISQLSQSLLKRFEMLAKSDNERESQRGFGLIELCISLLLASCIMSGLIQHYLQIKRQYQLVQTTIENTSELQWVSELIRMSVRKAGFTPCQAVQHLQVMDQRNGQQHIPSLIVHDDALQINRMSDEFVTLPTISHRGDIEIISHRVFQQDHPIMIADCYHAEIQHIAVSYQTTQGQRIQLNKPLAFEYQAPIYVGQWIEESYFMNRHVQGHDSLAYRRYHTEELTQLIHNMRVSLQQRTRHAFVRVMLHVQDGRIHTVDTRARMS